MENPSGKQQMPNMQELMRFAGTSAGKQLIATLRQQGGEDLQNALQKASAGDYTDAKKTISSLLESPEMKALLEQLGR